MRTFILGAAAGVAMAISMGAAPVSAAPVPAAISQTTVQHDAGIVQVQNMVGDREYIPNRGGMRRGMMRHHRYMMHRERRMMRHRMMRHHMM